MQELEIERRFSCVFEIDTTKETTFHTAMRIMKAMRDNYRDVYELHAFDRSGRENIHGCREVAC